MEARLNSGGSPEGLSETPCHWCLKYFGKLDWLKDFPDSPWTAWLLDENGRNAKPLMSKAGTGICDF